MYYTINVDSEIHNDKMYSNCNLQMDREFPASIKKRSQNLRTNEILQLSELIKST